MLVNWPLHWQQMLQITFLLRYGLFYYCITVSFSIEACTSSKVHLWLYPYRHWSGWEFMNLIQEGKSYSPLLPFSSSYCLSENSENYSLYDSKNGSFIIWSQTHAMHIENSYQYRALHMIFVIIISSLLFRDAVLNLLKDICAKPGVDCTKLLTSFTGRCISK